MARKISYPVSAPEVAARAEQLGVTVDELAADPLRAHIGVSAIQLRTGKMHGRQAALDELADRLTSGGPMAGDLIKRREQYRTEAVDAAIADLRKTFAWDSYDQTRARAILVRLWEDGATIGFHDG